MALEIFDVFYKFADMMADCYNFSKMYIKSFQFFSLLQDDVLSSLALCLFPFSKLFVSLSVPLNFMSLIIAQPALPEPHFLSNSHRNSSQLHPFTKHPKVQTTSHNKDTISHQPISRASKSDIHICDGQWTMYLIRHPQSK